MIDELNTLALDINSVLEADVPDELWQSFHKGDRSIFARRLFKQKDSYTIPALEQRFERDQRFRDMVSRYIGRFDELMAEASVADPEGMLRTCFITADVGKLYLVLARTLGRNVQH
jgi:hypothetical protein